LYGQKISTHHGKYVYRKRGILDDIPFRKLIRGVFVIQDKDKKWIIDFLKRFSAEYYVRVVELTEEDCEIMGLQIEQFYPKADQKGLPRHLGRHIHMQHLQYGRSDICEHTVP